MTASGQTTEEETGQPSVARNMLTALIGNAVPPALALLSGPILAQSLGVHGRGVVAAAAAPVALISNLAGFGIVEATSYTVARKPQLVGLVARRAASLLIVTSLLATGLMLSLRSWLAGDEPEVYHLIAITALAVVPSVMVGVLRGCAAGLMQFTYVARDQILSSSLRILALVPFWLTNQLTPAVATVILALMPVFGALGYVPLLPRLRALAPDPDGDAGRRTLAGYGIRVWLGAISGVLISRIDQTLMTPLSTTYELGLYVVAVSVSELPLVIYAAIRDVTFVSDASRRDDDRLALTARVSTLVCLAVATGVGVTMIWWLPWLFGNGFAGALVPSAILLAAVVGQIPGSVAGAALSARGNPGMRSISLIIASLLNLALLVILLPRYGAIGAALATTGANLASVALNLLFLQRIHQVQVSRFFAFRPADVRALAQMLRRVVSRRR